MCRLYGFHASEATKVECSLVHAQNALLIQSRSDLRGVAHADGWGIACYSGEALEVERCDTAAHADLHFSVTAERVFAETVIAHVRRATVGTPSITNTHPFRHGHWVFAHNGTVTGFESLRPELERETDPHLQTERRGTTDSEQAFYWLLSRMAQSGIDIASRSTDIRTLVPLLASSVSELARRCEQRQPDKEAKLNFLLTDGRTLLATRWGNTLHWVRRDGIHDCEICGIAHVRHEPTREYHAVIVASEPISREAWEPIEQGHILAVGSDLESRVHSI